MARCQDVGSPCDPMGIPEPSNTICQTLLDEYPKSICLWTLDPTLWKLLLIWTARMAFNTNDRHRTSLSCDCVVRTVGTHHCDIVRAVLEYIVVKLNEFGLLTGTHFMKGSRLLRFWYVLLFTICHNGGLIREREREKYVVCQTVKDDPGTTVYYTIPLSRCHSMCRSLPM